MSASTRPDSTISFLTVVPRGLQDVAVRALRDEARAACATEDASKAAEDGMLRVSIWGQEADDSIGKQAVDLLKEKQRGKEEKREKKV